MDLDEVEPDAVGLLSDLPRGVQDELPLLQVKDHAQRDVGENESEGEDGAQALQQEPRVNELKLARVLRVGRLQVGESLL
jgi:hypothetical protein